ncbi:AfsR/SARP family transcriptional regulator [Amycolatopsis sp. H20-H5]|uniref:AfsR/SARP family transcriptional regulator n=1 Tax=Amycolatopsis sp. H20-H5 TaxID=3046309 RepID=UPI002DBA6BC2|nr:BTAD domain-containing putative transcriptional regulator [Amycolatopsis sp. H20-H5]MEC3978289.1 BTAD domain-containing putative transcriptional regulator [Amycolatopsis sp. H20-H5]
MSSTSGQSGDKPVYRILGPLEISDAAGRELRIPPGRQQTVLGALLLDVNRVVSLDRLIEAIWYSDPPATARTQVQICVSRLRGTLATIGGTGDLMTRGPGYVLLVADSQLDADAFATLVAESAELTSKNALEEAAQLLGRAIALWRGPALSGTTSRTLEAKASHLDEQRLNAVEAYVELRLRLGRHHQLIGELAGLVTAHPLRERLRGQLMLALYRSGRQAEALETYRAGRELLVEQLGLEPGDELRQLETAILAGDSGLQQSPAPAPVAEPPAVVPFQLPTDIADFTGRDVLIGHAERLLLGGVGKRATPVVVLAGKPGVGKTALALHIAHRLAESRYPDGQLYCDLGGTRAHPATPLDVLGRFLRALGLPGAAIPDSVDERAETYRHLLAGKRMLVVLDDAGSERQVRALLPGSSSSVVLVTSRTRLTGLAGAGVLDVEVLDTTQAIGMLATMIGDDRVAAEPAAAQALVRLVGGLPLALRIVAARLAARPSWSLAWMLDRLSNERRRLDELTHGEMMVRASLALTYDGLEPDVRRLLRLLSAFDCLSFPAWVAAALLEVDLFHAADLLERLVDAQMLEVSAVEEDGSPRYKFHDLIRLFAREQLDEHEQVAGRHAALGRVAGGWLGIAREAHNRIYGGEFTVLHGQAPRWLPPATYLDRILADPLVWLEAEHDNLCSIVTLTAEATLAEWSWDLAVTLVALFETRCYFDEWERTHRQALEAVRAVGNRRGEAALLCSLGSMHLSRAQPEAATAPLTAALTTFDALGDAHGKAMARRNLALLDQAGGDEQAASARFHQALAEFREAGDPVGEAYVLGRIAQIELDGGDEEAAGARLTEALRICLRTGTPRVEVQLRYRLSELMMRQYRHEEAAQVLAEVLEMARAARDLVGEARILHRLGLVQGKLGRRERAEQLLLEALEVQEQISGATSGTRMRADLATLQELPR